MVYTDQVKPKMLPPNRLTVQFHVKVTIIIRGMVGVTAANPNLMVMGKMRACGDAGCGCNNG